MQLQLAFAYSLGIITGIYGYGYDHHSEWGYEGETAPGKWKGDCQGHLKQSPIDIIPSAVDFASLDGFQFLNYDFEGDLKLTNTGRTLLATGFDKWIQNPPMIQGGGLKNRYKLVQFHLHWGHHDGVGSEHSIASLKYPGELHLVHVHEELSLPDALSQPDGIAVLGIFLSKTSDPNPNNFSNISETLKSIMDPETSTNLTAIRPEHLLPNNTDSFYRYEGSLTTPNCSEAVFWTIFTEPLEINRQQIDLLRKIQNAESLKTENCRPTQPLNGRRIQFRSCSTLPTSFMKIVFFGIVWFNF